METKVCSKCGIEKLLSEFYSHAWNKDGLNSNCKTCISKKLKEYRKTKKYRKWLKSEKHKEARWKERLRDKEKIKIRHRKDYLNHREERIKYQREHIKTHPWMRHLNNIRYRCNNSNDRKYKYYGGRGIKCFLTLKQIKYLWERDKAFEMRQPCIHRNNNNGNYIVKNCQFKERKEHSILHQKR